MVNLYYIVFYSFILSSLLLLLLFRYPPSLSSYQCQSENRIHIPFSRVSLVSLHYAGLEEIVLYRSIKKDDKKGEEMIARRRKQKRKNK